MPLSQAELEADVLGGFKNQHDRMKDAWDNLRFSQGRFEEYPTQHKDQRYKQVLPRRTSPIFKRVVEVLTMHLYKSQPTRKLGTPEATEFLSLVYKRSAMGARLKRADELCLVGGFAGIQFSGSTDPAAPVKATLWGPDELAIYQDPDDETKLAAVATVDKIDNQRRCRLWTKDFVTTYTTEKGIDQPAFGSAAFKQQSRKPNPYRGLPDPETGEPTGLLPFAFTHWNFPTQTFETNSPGNNLRELNDHVNNRLDLLGDSIPYQARPIGIATGVNAAWKPPVEYRPGDFIALAASDVDATGAGPLPTLSYLLGDLGYIAADWQDINFYLDHSLEMHNCPPALIRMLQSGAQSGASLQAEQLPLLGWIEGRRGMWEWYEEEIARVCLLVAASHLAAHGFPSEAAALMRAFEPWSFSLRWPPLYIQLPGPDRDRADDWRLQRGLADKIAILMERQGLSEEEAFDQLLQTKQRNDRLTAAGIEPGIPAPPNPFAPAPGQASPFDPSQPTPPAEEGAPNGAN